MMKNDQVKTELDLENDTTTVEEMGMKKKTSLIVDQIKEAKKDLKCHYSNMLVLTDSLELSEKITVAFGGRVEVDSPVNYASSLVTKFHQEAKFSNCPKFISDSKNKSLFIKSCKNILSSEEAEKLYKYQPVKNKSLDKVADQVNISHSLIIKTRKKFSRLKQHSNLISRRDVFRHASRMIKKFSLDDWDIVLPELLFIDQAMHSKTSEKRMINRLANCVHTTIILKDNQM